MLLATLVVTVWARLGDARRSNDELAADARDVVVEMRGLCARKYALVVPTNSTGHSSTPLDP